jgi:replicative DNA helicase
MHDKAPPHSKRHEYTCLSIAIEYPTVEGQELCDEFEDCNPFYLPECAKVFEALRRIDKENVSAVTILDYLENQNSNVDVMTLRSIINNCITEHGFNDRSKFALYKGWVKLNYMKRQSLLCIAKAQSKIYDNEHKLSDVIDELKTALTDNATEQKQKGTSIGEAVLELGERIKSPESAGLSIPGMPRFNDKYCGMRMPPGLYVIGARPKTGKTAFGITLTRHIAKTGIWCGYHSAEVPPWQISQRIICSEGNISDGLEGIHRTCTNQLEYMKKLTDEVTNMPIKIFENRSWQEVKRSIKAHPEIKVWFVDYLTLLSEARQGGKRNDLAIANITGDAKALSSEKGLWIFMLAQVNKSAGAGRPRPDMLYGSDAIAQDADAVFLLYNNMGNQTDQEKDQVKADGYLDTMVSCDLNRHTETGYYTSQFYAKYGYFHEGVAFSDIPS